MPTHDPATRRALLAPAARTLIAMALGPAGTPACVDAPSPESAPMAATSGGESIQLTVHIATLAYTPLPPPIVYPPPVVYLRPAYTPPSPIVYLPPAPTPPPAVDIRPLDPPPPVHVYIPRNF